MHEFSIRVPIESAEDVLDRLLPLAPLGVLEVPRDDHVELRIRGRAGRVPDRDAVAAAAGDHAVTLAERGLPDDPDELARLDYEPRVVAGRFVIRPPWAPAADGDLVDVVVSERPSFGDGSHATTVMCLEEIARHASRRGSFADLGSGSGVLAISAARLGYEPITALDYTDDAIAAIQSNAALNDVEIEVRKCDLTVEPAPAAAVVVANVPLHVHRAIAANLAEPPAVLIASGVTEAAGDDLVSVYATQRMYEETRRSARGWCLAVLRSP